MKRGVNKEIEFLKKGQINEKENVKLIKQLKTSLKSLTNTMDHVKKAISDGRHSRGNLSFFEDHW